MVVMRSLRRWRFLINGNQKLLLPNQLQQLKSDTEILGRGVRVLCCCVVKGAVFE
jgi:hypothetical protein